jgi:glycosyltransferase involved in cell wall biosynthesis
MLDGIAEVRIWSEYEPAPFFTRVERIRCIRPFKLDFPRGGTLVFVGVYFRIGHWVRFARPRRVVVLYNTDQPDRLRKNIRRLSGTGCRTELIYTSVELRRRHRADSAGLDGPVLESPIDTHRFHPSATLPVRPFTVGRMSRDTPSKHHEEDPELWRALAKAGCRVRIMGGTCLARELSGVPNIELLPAGAEDAAAFLRGLDCFVYRTSRHWFEGYGRVVAEAMATGLPVVVGRPGGYVDYVTNGINGYIFDTSAEALAAVMTLQHRRDIVAAFGRAGRVVSERINRDWLPRRTIELIAGPPMLPPIDATLGWTQPVSRSMRSRFTYQA